MRATRGPLAFQSATPPLIVDFYISCSVKSPEMFRRVIASVSRASFSAAARLSAQPRRWTSLAVAGAAACAVSAAVAAPAAFIAFADAPRERTFVMIKPDAVNRRLISEIIGRFEKRGFKIVAMRFLKPSREMAEAHYAEHKGRPFFNGLVDFLTSGPVVALVVEGDSAVSVTRSMLGVTKPSASPTGYVQSGCFLCFSSRGPCESPEMLRFSGKMFALRTR